MALGVRGANPIWSEVDLQGNLFDETFYMFVLENTLPYIPALVYQDPDLNIAWNFPIKFLGNGTLPNNIYFEEGKVYRLEFRQGPTQDYPLIYPVENYTTGGSGNTPIDSVAFASSNQITNPQFALMDFDSSFTFSGAAPGYFSIAANWGLVLQGTGSFTINRVALNNSNPNPSNAPYALQITLAGWDAGGAFLVQRIQQNGMLWANKYVSSAITARIQGEPQSISASLVDSNNTPLGVVLSSTVVNSDFNEFTGYAQLGESTNPNTPPAAYIDYRLALPSNVDIYVTSLQLVVQDTPVRPAFEQDSISRQIDHTYHVAFPIVPVGTVIDYYAFGDLEHYLYCDGLPISRTTYNKLFNKVTVIETVNLISSTQTFTVADGSVYPIGAPLEGNGIQAGAVITGISGNVVTMSLNATVTAASPIRFFCVGSGDGSTTFNKPNLKGYVLAGAGAPEYGTLFSSVGPGAVGGTTTHTISISEMPAHNHPGSSGSSPVGGGGGGIIPTASNASQSALLPVTVNVASQGGGTPISLVQPTRLARKFIRYE